MIPRILALLFLVALLAACGGGMDRTRPAQPASLVDTVWVLQLLDGQPLLDGTTVTLQFAPDGLNGSAGCNNYFGSFQVQDGRLTIGPVGTTEMYCMDPEGLMHQEQAFLTALSTVAGYRLTAEQLELLDSTGQTVLSLTPPSPMPEMTLEGTEWVLTTLLDGATAKSVLKGTEITLRLEGGSASGSAGCNTYFGPYTLEGGTLSIGMLASTKKFCQEPAGSMEQEGQYLSMLQSVTSFELDVNQLTLRMTDGRGLVFSARP